MRMHVLLVLAAAALIALPAASAIADDIEHVVIVKCAEDNVAGTEPVVFQRQASKDFGFPTSCYIGIPSPATNCAQCLRDLILKKDCAASDKFPGTPVVTQLSFQNAGSFSIEKYVFACGENNDDDDR